MSSDDGYSRLKSDPPVPIEPNLVGHDQCTGTVPGIISYNCFAQTQSYENDLGHIVPNRIKIKIVNGEYANLGQKVTWNVVT